MKQTILSFLLFPVFLLAEDGQAPSADQALSQTLIMVVLALVLFYFILWRPEQKRRKTMQKKQEAMKKGDRVIAMGIVGTVSKIEKESVIIKTATSEIEVLKAVIQEVGSET